MNTDSLYNEALETLKEAYDQYKTTTNNQQGMPGHLMRVARLFDEAATLIKKLEKKAIKDSRRWTKDLLMNSSSNTNNSSNNSNNNNSRRKTKKLKRNHH